MEGYHLDFITHYFRKGTQPFQSLSSLDDDQAIEIMMALQDETIFGARFKDPAQYLHNRRQSNWMIEQSPDKFLHKEIRISLSDLNERDVSFTYPDSMISYWLGREKSNDLFLPGLHGKVFTRKEILAIVKQKGDPENQ